MSGGNQSGTFAAIFGFQKRGGSKPATEPRPFGSLVRGKINVTTKGSHKGGSMVGNDRLNVPAIDTFSH